MFSARQLLTIMQEIHERTGVYDTCRGSNTSEKHLPCLSHCFWQCRLSRWAGCPIFTMHPDFVDEWEKVLKGTLAAGDVFSYGWSKITRKTEEAWRFYAGQVHWFCWALKIHRNQLVLKVRLLVLVRGFWFGVFLQVLGVWGIWGVFCGEK